MAKIGKICKKYVQNSLFPPELAVNAGSKSLLHDGLPALNLFHTIENGSSI